MGEVRDAGVEGIALVLKAHLVGPESSEHREQPENTAPVGLARARGGGYSAVDMALHDIASRFPFQGMRE